MQRHRVDQRLDLLDAAEMPRDVEMHAAPGVLRTIVDGDAGGDRAAGIGDDLGEGVAAVGESGLAAGGQVRAAGGDRQRVLGRREILGEADGQAVPGRVGLPGPPLRPDHGLRQRDEGDGGVGHEDS